MQGFSIRPLVDLKSDRMPVHVFPIRWLAPRVKLKNLPIRRWSNDKLTVSHKVLTIRAVLIPASDNSCPVTRQLTYIVQCIDIPCPTRPENRKQYGLVHSYIAGSHVMRTLIYWCTCILQTPLYGRLRLSTWIQNHVGVGQLKHQPS